MKKKKIDEGAVYSPQEVAELIGVNEATVRRYCRTGKLKFSRPGGKNILIRGSAIIEMMDDEFDFE